MPKLRVDPSFGKRLQKKDPSLQAAILKTVKQLGEDPSHSGLHTHAIRGTRNPKVFEAYVDRKNRVTWHWEDGVVVLRNHCNHDILRQRP